MRRPRDPAAGDGPRVVAGPGSVADPWFTVGDAAATAAAMPPRTRSRSWALGDHAWRARASSAVVVASSSSCMAATLPRALKLGFDAPKSGVGGVERNRKGRRDL